MITKNNNSYHLSQEQALATVNINLGLGQNNPVLKIYEHTNIQKLIKDLIQHYNLPQKLFDVIFSKVQERLNEQNVNTKKIQVRQNRSSLLKKQNLQKSREKRWQQEKMLNPLGQKTHKTQIVLKKKYNQNKQKSVERPSIESIYSSNKSFSKRQTSHKNLPQTFNNKQKSPKNTHNNKSKSPNFDRKNQSPFTLNKTNNLSKQKYQSKPIRSISPKPNKQNVNNQNRTPSFQNHKEKNNQTTPIKVTQNLKLSTEQKIRQLFLFMTKKNPPHVKILTPEYINLKGIQKQCLQNLQKFCQKLKEDQFDRMTLQYFIKKVKELKFQKILSQIKIN